MNINREDLYFSVVMAFIGTIIVMCLVFFLYGPTTQLIEKSPRIIFILVAIAVFLYFTIQFYIDVSEASKRARVENKWISKMSQMESTVRQKEISAYNRGRESVLKEIEGIYWSRFYD